MGLDRDSVKIELFLEETFFGRIQQADAGRRGTQPTCGVVVSGYHHRQEHKDVRDLLKVHFGVGA